jgi:hypothetical protein
MIQYWMEHVCVGCGGVYHYTLRRLRRPRPRVRMRPRPICGLYQPDMVASKQVLYHLVLGVRAAGLAGLVGIGGVLELDPGWIATGGATVIPVLTLLAQGVLLLWDPNRNLKANRQKAKRLVEANLLEQLRGGTTELVKGKLPRPCFGAILAFALIGLLFAILPFATAKVVRLAFGWPLNRCCYPPSWGRGTMQESISLRISKD